VKRRGGRTAPTTSNRIGLAASNHHSALGRYPAGGWGYAWIGDPDRGNDWKQPGGWIFNLLPYIEQEGLHQLQAGKVDADKKAAASRMISTPLSMLHCPTRRPPRAYDTVTYRTHFQRPKYAARTTHLGRSDYAANGGDVYTDPGREGTPWNATGPGTYNQGVAPGAKAEWDKIAAVANGVVYAASEVGSRKVEDGTSNTYLFGEKYLNPDMYTNGVDAGDAESMYVGDNIDVSRWSGPWAGQPRQDRSGFSNWFTWGSAHPSGFNMVMCDGSVHAVSYSIDLEIHRRLGNRQDGEVVDASQL